MVLQCNFNIEIGLLDEILLEIQYKGSKRFFLEKKKLRIKLDEFNILTAAESNKFLRTFLNLIFYD